MENFKIVPISKQNELMVNWRKLYFQSCYEGQELFVEQKVMDSKAFSIVIGLKPIGYFIVYDSKIILEFFLEKKFLHLQDQVFSHLIQIKAFSKAWIKTFDPLFLKMANMFGEKNRGIGLLFRDTNSTETKLKKEMVFKKANLEDMDIVTSFKWDFFDNQQDMEYFFKKGTYLFYVKHEFVGIGTLMQIHPLEPFFDIGVCVKPDYRKRGFGAQIVLQLKNHCLENNRKPICGCAFENVASKKTLEKAGFISRHALIEFKLEEQA